VNNDLPKGTFVVGNKLYGKCIWCGKGIRINKPILGSLHLCLTEEEKLEIMNRGSTNKKT